MRGAGARVGTGAGNAEKGSPPQAVEWGGAGKRAGGPRFSGPVCPVTNSNPASDMVELRPNSRSVDFGSCVSSASCTQAGHLIASDISGHPSQYRVPSRHMQLSNPASHASRP